eukprot:COSAG01_NODE_148_length_24037_cov_219.235859_6_plen_47_part_00
MSSFTFRESNILYGQIPSAAPCNTALNCFLPHVSNVTLQRINQQFA